MGYLVSFKGGSTIREDLIARLIRQTADDFRACTDVDEILRACIGAALAHDLSDAETQWLMSGIEGQLGLCLSPMARIA